MPRSWRWADYRHWLARACLCRLGMHVRGRYRDGSDMGLCIRCGKVLMYGDS